MRVKKKRGALIKLLLFSGLLCAAENFPVNAKDNEIEFQTEFTKICDMRAGATVTPECSGFVTALIQLHQFGLLLPNWTPQFCTPFDITAREAVIKMRPWFHNHSETCEGKCNATTFALRALASVYPCK